MYYLSRYDQSISIIDENTLIESEVTEAQFIELLADYKIKPNSGECLKMEMIDGGITTDLSVLKTGKYNLSFNELISTTDIILRDLNFVSYNMYNGKFSWRERLMVNNDFGTFAYRKGDDFYIWYNGFLHKINQVRGFLGLYYRNYTMYCRVRSKIAGQIDLFVINGSDRTGAWNNLEVRKCSIQEMKRALLLGGI